MTSRRRIDANRRNAQLLTGPRTPRGKAAARYHSPQDGPTTRHAVLEDAAGFEEPLCAAFPAEANLELKNQNSCALPTPLRRQPPTPKPQHPLCGVLRRGAQRSVEKPPGGAVGRT